MNDTKKPQKDLSASKNSLAANLAIFAVFAAFIVIAFGAFTRLADAGLGCPDWPTCYGHVLWPQTDAQVDAANTVFNETPVEMDKTWPEQVHRLFASSLGLISLILFGLAARNNEDKVQNRWMGACVVLLVLALVAKIGLKMTWSYGAEAMHDAGDVIVGLIVLALFGVIVYAGKRFESTDSAVKLTAFLVGFVILQGLFGMWTVTLKVWPQVVTLHLLGGFTVVSIIWLLVQRLKAWSWVLPSEEARKLVPLKSLAKLGLLIVFLQIALGGWTTSNYAAVACPDLPTCQTQWWPDMDFATGFDVFQEIGPNYLGGQMENEARVAIHMAHRIGAIVTTLFLFFLFFRLLQTGSSKAVQLGLVMMGVLILQVALGLSNILFHFPLSVAVLHNGVGAVLLLVLVTLNHRILTLKQSDDS